MTARWSIPIQTLADRVKVGIETVARKSTLDVFTAVVLKSPVDTGRFRANWNVSYGVADLTVSESTDKARGLAEAKKPLTLPVGGVMHLSNGLPYARRLEYGWSKRAPAGMVRITAQEFSDYVAKAVAK
jgi:hypothetical protein